MKITIELLESLDKHELVKLHERHIGPTSVKFHGRARYELIKKFCPKAIKPCVVCQKPGIEMPYVGSMKSGGNYGVLKACPHHTRLEKLKATNMDRYGYEWANYNPEIKAKEEATRMKKYGVRNVGESKEIQKRVQATNLKRYGGNPAATEEVKAKIREAHLKRYGVANSMACPTVRAKRRKTMIARYGTEHALENPEILASMLQKLQAAKGIRNVMELPEVRERIRQTNLDRYGVENPMQATEVFGRMQKSAHRYKSYTTKDGRILQLQGYEPQVVKALEDSGWYVRLPKHGIHYDFKGKRRVYHPDLLAIKGKKVLVIEVKSEYTLRGGPAKEEGRLCNRAKFAAAIERTQGNFRVAVVLGSRITLIRNVEKYSADQMLALARSNEDHPDLRRKKCL